MKTIQEVIELVYSRNEIPKLRKAIDVLPNGLAIFDKAYQLDISFLMFNFTENVFGRLENCAEKYIIEHSIELFGSPCFSKLDLMALVYPTDNIGSVDSAIPQSYAEFLHRVGLGDSIRFLVMDYHNNMFGEVVNLAEKFILQKFIDGEKLNETLS